MVIKRQVHSESAVWLESVMRPLPSARPRLTHQEMNSFDSQDIRKETSGNQTELSDRYGFISEHIKYRTMIKKIIQLHLEGINTVTLMCQSFKMRKRLQFVLFIFLRLN